MKVLEFKKGERVKVIAIRESDVCESNIGEEGEVISLDPDCEDNLGYQVKLNGGRMLWFSDNELEAVNPQ